MMKEEFLEMLRKDIKSARTISTITGIILTGLVLFILISITQGITITEKDIAAAVIGLIFLTGFLLTGLFLLRNGLRPVEVNTIYHAFQTNPSLIVWIYKKVENRNGIYSYELVMCHINKKKHDIPCKNSVQLDTLHKAALSFHPQAIPTYRLEWESLYKKTPEQFIKQVNNELKNINNIPFTNSTNTNFHL